LFKARIGEVEDGFCLFALKFFQWDSCGGSVHYHFHLIVLQFHEALSGKYAFQCDVGIVAGGDGHLLLLKRFAVPFLIYI
jgi:hypothetical protein